MRGRERCLSPRILGLTGSRFPPNRTFEGGRNPANPIVRKARLANSDRGTKRTDPETGKKFYDLNKDPIVSPYTGKSYPRSYFEQILPGKPAPARARAEDDEEEEVEEDEVEDANAPEIVSLEDADDEAEGGEDIPDVEDVEVEEDLGDDEEDVFLEEDEDEDDIDFDVGNEDER